MENKKFEIVNKILKELNGQTVEECLDILEFVRIRFNKSSVLNYSEDL
jgi:hypothetical protein